MYHKQQTSISNFGAPPRTTDRFAAHTHQNSDPAPRVKRPASTPTISPAHADGFVPLGDYVHRVRKGSFGVFTENPDSQGCRNQFLSDFSCFRMVVHRFEGVMSKATNRNASISEQFCATSRCCFTKLGFLHFTIGFYS